jgi:hypothetical protein
VTLLCVHQLNVPASEREKKKNENKLKNVERGAKKLNL